MRAEQVLSDARSYSESECGFAEQFANERVCREKQHFLVKAQAWGIMRLSPK
jgi:hypothetical protein